MRKNGFGKESGCPPCGSSQRATRNHPHVPFRPDHRKYQVPLRKKPLLATQFREKSCETHLFLLAVAPPIRKMFSE